MATAPSECSGLMRRPQLISRPLSRHQARTLGPKRSPLGQGVEDQVIHQRQQFVQFLFRPARGKGVHFAAGIPRGPGGLHPRSWRRCPTGAVAFGAGEQGKLSQAAKPLRASRILARRCAAARCPGWPHWPPDGLRPARSRARGQVRDQQGQEMLHVSVFCRGWGEERAAARGPAQGGGRFFRAGAQRGKGPRAPSPETALLARKGTSPSLPRTATAGRRR